MYRGKYCLPKYFEKFPYFCEHSENDRLSFRALTFLLRATQSEFYRIGSSDEPCGTMLIVGITVCVCYNKNDIMTNLWPASKFGITSVQIVVRY